VEAHPDLVPQRLGAGLDVVGVAGAEGLEVGDSSARHDLDEVVVLVTAHGTQADVLVFLEP